MNKQVCVLITRPQHQASRLLARLTELGFKAWHFPTIAIKDISRAEENIALMRQLENFQLAIFISQNAVTYGLQLLRATDNLANIPPTVAIGRSTRNLLENHGVQVAAYPAHPSSEAVLNLPLIKRLASDDRVLIFRGQGGKEVLAKTLRERKISVQYAEVYQRLKPSGVTLSLTQNQANVIMVTSADSLQNLVAIAAPDSASLLLNTPVIIGSTGMVELYESLGFRQPPIAAASPLDDDMVSALTQWQEQCKP